MTDLTLSEFEWCKNARTLNEALQEEARNFLGADYLPAVQKGKEQEGRTQGSEIGGSVQGVHQAELAPAIDC